MTSPRRAVIGARLAGVPSSAGRAELGALVAGVVAGQPEATLGLDLGGPDRPTRDEVWSALAGGWGVDATPRTVTIAVERTLAAAGVVADCLADVCRTGGSVALATGRPASMLGCYQELAHLLTAAGATVLRSNAPAHGSAAGAERSPWSIWWVGGVAVATDGRALRADDGALRTDHRSALAGDWLFGVGRPDLVIADRGFAAAAVAAGHRTVAPADVDAVALEVVARRGAPVTIVPLDCGRPPEAYAPLVALLMARVAGLEAGPGPGGPSGPARPSGGDPRTGRPPHSTTPPPGAYAAPESGGEG
ncbi:MAG TPA: phosphatase [Acidimicrobiia bacterium]|nr:phosphatase [Acidimicrobiia bacterium]